MTMHLAQFNSLNKKKPSIRKTKSNLARWAKGMVSFNKDRKSKGERAYTLDEYIDHIHGKIVKDPRPFEKMEVKKSLADERMEANKKLKSVTEFKGSCSLPDDSYKDSIKGKYTVAIAYNKGGYTVIPADEVKHIGK